MIERGDITNSSFGFDVIEERWSVPENSADPETTNAIENEHSDNYDSSSDNEDYSLDDDDSEIQLNENSDEECTSESGYDDSEANYCILEKGTKSELAAILDQF